MNIIIAGLAMTGVFITLEKWGFYKWFYDVYVPRKPWAWLPSNFCQHCVTFWVTFLVHAFFVYWGQYDTNVLQWLGSSLVAGLGSCGVVYLVFK